MEVLNEFTANSDQYLTENTIHNVNLVCFDLYQFRGRTF